MLRASHLPSLQLSVMRRAVLLIAAACAATIGAFGPTAHAATGAGSTITTSPVSVSLSAAPGNTVTTKLQLQNSGTQPVDIAVKLEKFKASGTNGQAQIYAPDDSDPSLSWVQFAPAAFTALPGVWNSVTMTIAVPKTAAFGYYYAAVFTPASTNSAVPGINTFRGANAVLVLLNVHVPGEKNRLEVAGFNADKHAYQYLPVNLSVKVHNSGDIYAAPKGNVYISRTPTGSVIDTLALNNGAGNVLPGTDRVFPVVWDDGFPSYQAKRVNGQIVSDAQGKPVYELNWDFSRLTHFRFGRYYARLVMVYNDGSRDIAQYGMLSFWVIPWTILGILTVVLGLILVGLWTIVRFMLRQRHARRFTLR